ncbi:integrase core domain-containing protein [Candidatus Manganitrophus noduliformans]|nr:integrase core domain-containing protein [Candidatus Manganitrophus noduliformans]
MSAQKEAVLQLVAEQKERGRPVRETLVTLSVPRSTYYRWKKSNGTQPDRANRADPLTPEEKERIEAVKAAHPHLRHRQIQGVLQKGGTYLSFSAIYQYLKGRGLVEPYERRPAPWETPRYEVWQKNLMWGCDWTKLKIGDLRWYLLTLIDFFSRLIIAFEIVPTVNASHVKQIYRKGLLAQGILLASERKPELRVDQGSPNTSWVTKEFFEIIGAELSFARVRRPTDNAITERFYGTIKQEEIYLVGSYPDEQSAREEIGRYVGYYNTDRPHQSLMNFTPDHVHQVNNKTALLDELKEMKKEARKRRKEYWRTVEKVTH